MSEKKKQKKNRIYRIFVINPGSTSTKISLHENENMLYSTDVFHDSSMLRIFPTINDQLEYRMSVTRKFLEENRIDLTGIDAIVGRGGPCRPVESGTYEVTKKLIDDTKNDVGGIYHASMLGVQMAERIHQQYGGRVFMVDPPVVDELQDTARVTGVAGVHRRAVCHALNVKATARCYAASLKRRYEDMNLIIAHIDGGISVTAHHLGRMIDGNDAGGGEGPFTPTRMGSMAVTDIFTQLEDASPKHLRDLCSQGGGLSSHFGTSDSTAIHHLVETGDAKAALIWKAMIYQTAKEIGAMAAVLEGNVDAILLTGGLLRFDDVLQGIQRQCGWIAPIVSYPGEMEHQAMAAGALRVLRGEEQTKVY